MIFFKFHCEGTVPHISLAYNILVTENSPSDVYFAIGKNGFGQLSTQAYAERQYGKFTYNNLMKVIVNLHTIKAVQK